LPISRRFKGWSTYEATVSQKKTIHQTFYYNFGKYRPTTRARLCSKSQQVATLKVARGRIVVPPANNVEYIDRARRPAHLRPFESAPTHWESGRCGIIYLL